ncbi:L-2,4-diaminobutyrate decarboxylase [Glycomyces artemisiae]|uniref:L-2,4-diaminobutyrate decarboxylase n=1 Tax=Glycomyces artemisiae TaxID=1076443 RepID=A0A2T0UVH2_9ACTN|nr:aspartate aminotransferase family protein [Glycomyces artemisiae]PRY61939.1 L-2,4-diaminobutyrate decarboxylase [Glycomyces artemisiae]
MLTSADLRPAPAPLDRTAPPALLGRDSAAAYRGLVADVAARLAERFAAVDQPWTGAAPAALAPAVAAVDLDRPLESFEAAFDEVGGLYLDDAVWFHHPRYLAHLNCPVALPAVAAETVLAAVNTSLDTWDQSAGGTLIEQRLIDWTAQRVGLGPDADGVFTSGGTQSNLHALLLARDEAVEAVLLKHRVEAGTPPRSVEVLPRLRFFASPHSHFSVVKAARILGLGEDAVVTVPADDWFRLNPAALDAAIETCREQGNVPAAVVATAGTTDFGSVDPLGPIAEIAAAHGVWLHVDAAYGCGLLVSLEHRGLLDGIGQADSVTVDYHKSFFQPVSSSALLVKDRAALRHVTHHADYLNPVEGALPNQVDKSLQTTRRFDALKLWMTLRTLGPDALGAMFDRVCALADQTWDWLASDPRFEVAAPPSQLSTVLFRLAGADDEVHRTAREALAASGEGMVAATRVEGRIALKLTLLNPETSLEDVVPVLEALARHGKEAK